VAGFSGEGGREWESARRRHMHGRLSLPF
jgi:hypothetical protein